MKLFKVAVASLILGVGFASQATDFTVKAKENSVSGGTGLNTGLVYNMGDLITGSVSVDDLWNSGALPRWSNANGQIGDLFYNGIDSQVTDWNASIDVGDKIGKNWNGSYSKSGFTFAYGTFVGQIGSTYFELGTDFSVAAPEAGTLNLFYWDSNKNDNSGSIVASITPVPEASTYALMLSGLGIVGLMVRRRKLKQ